MGKNKRKFDVSVVGSSSSKSHKNEHSSILDRYPIELSSLPEDIRAALVSAASSLLPFKKEVESNATLLVNFNSDIFTQHATQCAKESCDLARESTFPYLEDEAYAHSASQAYAAASCLFAEACLYEYISFRSSSSSSSSSSSGVDVEKSKEMLNGILRPIDLGLLRGGVKEWKTITTPIVEKVGDFLAELEESSNDNSSSDKEGVSNKEASINYQKRMDSAIKNCPPFIHQSNQTEGRVTSIIRIDASELTLEDFQNKYLNVSSEKQQPIIITNAINHWPAMSKWTDLSYFHKLAGCSSRLVPVEVCSSEDKTQTYLSDSWSQRVMSFSEYIDNYVDVEEGKEDDQKEGASQLMKARTAIQDEEEEEEEEDDDEGEEEEDFDIEGEEEEEELGCGYLAQHPLFDQIPILKRDIEVPLYCKAKSEEDLNAPESCEKLLDAPLISAWFGPKGTVSPLHNDPYHNLLCQVVGCKYLRLYHKSNSDSLYPRVGPLCNNSQLNIDEENNYEAMKKFPLFRRFNSSSSSSSSSSSDVGDDDATSISMVPCFQCVLMPSEILYIPRHMWHYVRSLETSFSTSFWFGAKMGLVKNDNGSYESIY